MKPLKPRRGSVFWAALDLNLAVMLTWNELDQWRGNSVLGRAVMALLAVIWLSWFFDEIRAIARTEITRTRSRGLWLEQPTDAYGWRPDPRPHP